MSHRHGQGIEGEYDSIGDVANVLVGVAEDAAMLLVDDGYIPEAVDAGGTDDDGAVLVVLFGGIVMRYTSEIALTPPPPPPFCTGLNPPARTSWFFAVPMSPPAQKDAFMGSTPPPNFPVEAIS